MHARNGNRIDLLRLVVFSGICTIAVCTAAAASPAGQLQQLFDGSWKPSPEGYEAAQQQFQQLQAVAAGDVRVPLSMALIAAKNYSYDDAQKYLEQSIAGGSKTKIDPIMLAALRLKIWVQVQRKDYAAAQSSIRELARVLSTEDATLPHAESKQTAEWLGGVLGFYSGPGANQTPSPIGDALASDVTKLLPGPLADTLADGKAAALKQYEQLQADQAVQRAELKSRNAAKRADEIQRNQTAQSAVAEKLKKLEDSASKSAADAKNNKTDTAATQKEQQKLQDQGNSLQRQLDEELRKPNRNERSIGRLRQELNNVQQQLANAGTAGNPADASKQKLETEQKRLQGLQARLEARGKQLASAPDDTLTTSLDSKIAMLSTYAPIDLDQEKQRILDSYIAK
jgi:hypothetical protein